MDYICGINWRHGGKVGRSSTWYKQRDAYMSEIRSRVQELVDKIRDHDRSELYSKNEPVVPVHYVNQMSVRRFFHTYVKLMKAETKAAHSLCGKMQAVDGLTKKLRRDCYRKNQLRIYTDFSHEMERVTKSVLTSTIAEKL